MNGIMWDGHMVNHDGTVEHNGNVEHNALMLNMRCGCEYVLTDEGVAFINEMDNTTLSKQDLAAKIEKQLCFKHRSQRMDEQTNILENSHLMPSDPAEAY
jgi:hypothetical protein